MDLEQLAVEIGAALATIPGLKVPPWGVERISPPAAIIALPDEITYGATYRRGKDKIDDLPVVILVSKTAALASRKAVAGYAAGDGPQSVIAAIDAHTFTAAHDVQVASCEFDDVTYSATVYAAAIFHLKITGKGAG